MQISLTCHQCGHPAQLDVQPGADTVQCTACHASLLVPTLQIATPMAGKAQLLQPGSTLGGFTIDCLIGLGGMGAVYQARQHSMDRQVALKILSPELSQDQASIDRFTSEVRLQARLEHPHIVTAFESGFEQGMYYLALALIDGESLQTRLDRDGPFAEAEALRLIRQVADSLAYAWDEHRILHRDIKPSNIMVNRRGDARVLDLGLSKCLAENSAFTAANIICGTPQYISPEQARGNSTIDFRADIYSLGVTLYALLTGQPTYPTGTPVEILYRHVHEPPPEPPPSVSRTTRTLLTWMLAKQPADRPADYQSLLHLIDAAIGQPSGTASAPPVIIAPLPPKAPSPAETPTTVTPIAPATPAQSSLVPSLKLLLKGGIVGCALWGSVLTFVLVFITYSFLSFLSGCFSSDPKPPVPRKVLIDDLKPQVGRRYAVSDDSLTIGPIAGGGYWLASDPHGALDIAGEMTVNYGSGGIVLLKDTPDNPQAAWANSLPDALRITLYTAPPNPSIAVAYTPPNSDDPIVEYQTISLASPVDSTQLAITITDNQLHLTVDDHPTQSIDLPWSLDDDTTHHSIYWGLHTGDAAILHFTPSTPTPPPTPVKPPKTYKITITSPGDEDTSEDEEQVSPTP